MAYLFNNNDRNDRFKKKICAYYATNKSQEKVKFLIRIWIHHNVTQFRLTNFRGAKGEGRRRDARVACRNLSKPVEACRSLSKHVERGKNTNT